MKTTYLNLGKKLANVKAVVAGLLLLTAVNSKAQCNANFTYTVGSGGVVNFQSVSSGTTVSSAYFWNFGSGNIQGGPTTSHTFTGSGTQNVCLTVYSNTTVMGACVDTVCNSISISAPCASLIPNFSYTVGAGGVVYFHSTSTGTTATSNYQWGFGGGSYSSGISTSHTYSSNGIMPVCLFISDSLGSGCSASKCDSIAVTTASTSLCSPSVVYSLYKDSTLALTWNAFPTYPSNVTNATWYWGDGSSTTGLYPSHTYSAAGTYSTCVTISVSCGTTTATYCYVATIFKSTQNNSMIQLIVKPSGTTGIKTNNSEISNLSIYPNPSNGELNLALGNLNSKSIKIDVYTIVDRLVHSSSQETTYTKIDLSHLQNGTYFIKVSTNDQTSTKKLIINK